mmetsp:Transcript_5484/g.9555  ORF Transcript_5484/g.9555 Transcript_5484/m.9555 type:complete len:527 (+) Transcript_5484:51-1631(+)
MLALVAVVVLTTLHAPLADSRVSRTESDGAKCLLQTGSSISTDRDAENSRSSGNHQRGVLLVAGGYTDEVLAQVGPWVGRIIQLKATASSPLEFAIMMEKEQMEKVRQVYPNFRVAFNFHLHLEDVRKSGAMLKSWSAHGAGSGDCRADVACMAHLKSIKINALRMSPFQETLFMDLDSTPCRPDFALPLFGMLLQGGSAVDMVIQPQLIEQWDSDDSLNASARSWFSSEPFEHNSAMIVFRKTAAMSYLFQVWSEKFHAGTFASDQPSLQLAIEQTKRQHGLNLVRLPINVFCRRATAAHLHCSAGCAAVRVGGDEYPRESFATKVILLGYKHTGTDLIQKALTSFWGESIPGNEQAERSFLSGAGIETWLYQTVRDVNRTDAGKKVVLEGAPWDVAPAYRRAAEAFPRALFVLPTRDSETWWKSVQCHAAKDKGLEEQYQKELHAATFAADNMVNAFESYNSDVVKYFENTLQQRRLLTVDLEKDGGVEQFVDNFCKNYVGCKTNKVMQMLSKVDTHPKDDCGM